jgi:hypothetical protein
MKSNFYLQKEDLKKWG